jgi:hypothetical protein
MKPPATAQNTIGMARALLTVFPGKYGFVIELPLKGSGEYAGGGPACPGYNDNPKVEEFNITIRDNGDGKFDPDYPDELSGTKTASPFPGASMTMRWRFIRLNRPW